MGATIQTMKIFVRAAEPNSFTAVARSMFIDRAAVSRAVKTLETELDVLLFARSTRTLKLTSEGARFYRDCIQVLKRFDNATQQFRTIRAAPHGRLNVGMAPGLPRRMLLRAVPQFQQRYPQIDIVLANVDDAIEIGDRGIDILIRVRSLRRRGGRHPERQAVIVRKLFQSKLVVCASPDYIDRAGVPHVPSELPLHACVAALTLEGDIQNEWQFVRSHERQKVRFDPKLVVHGGDTLREAGLSGCGIIRASAALIEEELRSRKLVPVVSEWECTGAPPMVAIYRKTRPTLPQVTAFVEHLMQAFQRYNRPPK
jgi:LysR family transcriptional regulator, regulator for bpeEF and oprC